MCAANCTCHTQFSCVRYCRFYTNNTTMFGISPPRQRSMHTTAPGTILQAMGRNKVYQPRPNVKLTRLPVDAPIVHMHAPKPPVKAAAPAPARTVDDEVQAAIDAGQYNIASTKLRKDLANTLSPKSMDTILRNLNHTPIMYLAVRNVWKDLPKKAVMDTAELRDACDLILLFVMKVWHDVLTCTQIIASLDFSTTCVTIIDKVKKWVMDTMSVLTDEDWPSWPLTMDRLEKAEKVCYKSSPSPFWVPNFTTWWNTLMFPDVPPATVKTLSTDSRVQTIRNVHSAEFIKRASGCTSWIDFWTRISTVLDFEQVDDDVEEIEGPPEERTGAAAGAPATSQSREDN